MADVSERGLLYECTETHVVGKVLGEDERFDVKRVRLARVQAPPERGFSTDAFELESRWPAADDPFEVGRRFVVTVRPA